MFVEEDTLTTALDSNEWDGLLGTHGVGVLTTSEPAGTLGRVPVSYALVKGVLYVRTSRRSELLAYISHDPRVSLLVKTGESWDDHHGVLIRGGAQVADGFERAARLASAFDQRFSDLLPPPLPGGDTEADDATAILRISPSTEPVSCDDREGATEMPPARTGASG